jgi:predicted metal-dependent hydrolase
MRLFLIIILIFLIICIIFNVNKKEMTYYKSDLDDQYYLVRDRIDKREAANYLANIKRRIKLLLKNLDDNKDKKYKEYKEYIDRLINSIDGVNISETPGFSNFTSYSVNKGEELVFCLRSKKYDNTFHNQNLMMYVVLHEIAHIACPEYGHGELFKKIFAFFTNVSMDLKLYKRIPFEKTPTEYCGLYITDSIV